MPDRGRAACLADQLKRVLARSDLGILAIKGTRPRSYQLLIVIACEQIPAAAATCEENRARIETRAILVAHAPAAMNFPVMG